MKCVSCTVEIPVTFRSAISANKCPGCGGRIMETNSTAAFVPLVELLTAELDKAGYGDQVNSESLATSIVSMFDVYAKGTKPQAIKREHDSAADEEDPDSAHKKRQVTSAKDILKKLRDEAYEGALRDQFGMGDTGSSDVSIGADEFGFEAPAANIGQQMVEQKQQDARSSIITGEKGAFRRST